MKTPAIIKDAKGLYSTTGPVEAGAILQIAESILAAQFKRGEALTSPAASKQWLIHKLATLDHEVFAVLWLDTRHRVLSFDELFTGTIDGASVYPREVVKAGLRHNAAACIFTHNHPSGIPEPSAADRAITRRLVDALALVEIRVLDHFVIGGTDAVSFAERGLI